MLHLDLFLNFLFSKKTSLSPLVDKRSHNYSVNIFFSNKINILYFKTTIPSDTFNYDNVAIS